MMIAVYVLIGVLSGMIFVACVALGWYLLREIRAARAVLEALNIGQIGQLLAYIPELVAVMKLSVQQNTALTGALETIGANTTPQSTASEAAEDAQELEIRRIRKIAQDVPMSGTDYDEQPTRDDATGPGESLY